jgi:hypothetical protein
MSPGLGKKSQPVDFRMNAIHEHPILAKKYDIAKSSKTS